MNKLGQTAYLAQWYMRALMGRRAPLQSVIFLLDRCNLRCKHCSVYELTNPRSKTFEAIRGELEDCYRAGSRFVDFEGGELYLWKSTELRNDRRVAGDNQPAAEYDINDVIDLAHEIGFYSATITTNAQLPFNGSHADQVFVSMDGVGKWHDDIRGEGTFARLEKHIRAFHREKPVCVNMVINNRNYPCLQETLDYVRENPDIDQIALNFHTPFKETEDLYLDPKVRNELIDMLIDCKHRGYPIMNTKAGLKAMKVHGDRVICTDRYCWITNFIFSDGSRSPKCMGYTHGVCDRCGFSMGGEMYSVFHLDPETILAGMNLRLK